MAKAKRETTMVAVTLDREMVAVDDRRAAVSAGSVYWPSWWAERRQHYPAGTHEIPAGTLLVGDLVGDELAFTESWHATVISGPPDDRVTMYGYPVEEVGPMCLVKLKHPRIIRGGLVLVAGGEPVVCGSRWNLVVYDIWALAPAERAAALSGRAGAIRSETEAEYSAKVNRVREPKELLVDLDDYLEDL